MTFIKQIVLSIILATIIGVVMYIAELKVKLSERRRRVNELLDHRNRIEAFLYNARKSGIPKIMVFEFKDGSKNITECSREELMEVIRYISAELENERQAHARSRNMFSALSLR